MRNITFSDGFTSASAPSVNSYGNIATKTATYTLTANEDVIFVSGTFTLTVPLAASFSGKVYKIVNKDTSNTNTITLARSGSDTFNAATSATMKTYGETIYLVSDGSSIWYLERSIPSVWTSYTPTCAGWVNGFVALTGSWRRVGDSIDVFVKVALTGVPDTATLDSITLPNSYAIDTTKWSGIATADAVIGTVSILDNALDYKGVAVMRSTTTFSPQAEVSSGTYTTYTGVTQALPFTFGSADSIQCILTGLPISGFGG